LWRAQLIGSDEDKLEVNYKKICNSRGKYMTQAFDLTTERQLNFQSVRKYFCHVFVLLYKHLNVTPVGP